MMSRFDRAIQKTMVFAGDVMGLVVGWLPDCGHDVDVPVEYDDDPFVSDSHLRYNEVSRTVTELTAEETDNEWLSATGTRWRWDGDRWTYKEKDNAYWVVAPWGYIPSRSGPFTAVKDAPVMDWRGWAVPAILEVLAEHRYVRNRPGVCSCSFDDPSYIEHSDWIDHVAPLIADRIGCDPARAMEALKTV